MKYVSIDVDRTHRCELIVLGPSFLRTKKYFNQIDSVSYTSIVFKRYMVMFLGTVIHLQNTKWHAGYK